MPRCTKDVARLLKKLEPFVDKPVTPAPEHIPPMPQVEGLDFLQVLILVGYFQCLGFDNSIFLERCQEFEVAPNALKPVEAWLTRYVGKIDYYKAEETYIFELQLRLDQLKAQLAGNTPKQRTEERPRPTDFIPPQPRLGEELIAQEMLTMIMVVMAKNQTEAQQICARRHVKYENVLKLILWYTSYIGTKHQKKLITNAQAEVDQHISQLEAQIAEIEAQLAAIEDQSAVPANTTEMPPSE